MEEGSSGWNWFVLVCFGLIGWFGWFGLVGLAWLGHITGNLDGDTHPAEASATGPTNPNNWDSLGRLSNDLASDVMIGTNTPAARAVVDGWGGGVTGGRMNRW